MINDMSSPTGAGPSPAAHAATNIGGEEGPRNEGFDANAPSSLQEEEPLEGRETLTFEGASDGAVPSHAPPLAESPVPPPPPPLPCPSHPITTQQVKTLLSLLKSHKRPSSDDAGGSDGPALLPLLSGHGREQIWQILFGGPIQRGLPRGGAPTVGWEPPMASTPTKPLLVVWIDPTTAAPGDGKKSKRERQKAAEDGLFALSGAFLLNVCRQLAIPHLCLEAKHRAKVKGLFQHQVYPTVATSTTPAEPFSPASQPSPPFRALEVSGVVLRRVKPAQAKSLARLVHDIPYMRATVEAEPSALIALSSWPEALTAAELATQQREAADKGPPTFHGTSPPPVQLATASPSLDRLTTATVQTPAEAASAHNPSGPTNHGGKRKRANGPPQLLPPHAPNAPASKRIKTTKTTQGSNDAPPPPVDAALAVTVGASTPPPLHSARTSEKAMNASALAGGDEVDDDDENDCEDNNENDVGNSALLDRLRLEERLSVLEAAVHGLAERKQSLERELEVADAERLSLAQLTGPLETQVVQLQSTRQRQSSLLETLSRSLAKSRQALTRLETSNLTVEEIVELAQEQHGMERDVDAGVHDAGVDASPALAAPVSSSSDTDSDADTERTVTAPGSEFSLYDNSSIQALPLPAQSLLVEGRVGGEPARIRPFLTQVILKDFWKSRDVGRAIMGFLPCLSSKDEVQKILNVCCREMLTLDSQLFPNPIHRRLALKHTCLDAGLLSVEKSITMKDEANEVHPSSTAPSVTQTLPTVNPDVALCPFELSGVCADFFCPYQHLQQRPNGCVLAREFLPLPSVKDSKRAAVRRLERPDHQAPRADVSSHGNPNDQVASNADYLALPDAADGNSSDEGDSSSDTTADNKDGDPVRWNWWSSQTNRVDAVSDADRLAFDEVLRSFGWVLTSDELTTETPRSLVQGCLFFGRVVESFRLAIHAGRFDTALTIVSFSEIVLRSWGNPSSRIVPIFAELCRKVQSILQAVHPYSFAFDYATEKNMFRIAAESQQVLGLASFILRHLYEFVDANADATDLCAESDADATDLCAESVTTHLQLVEKWLSIALLQLRSKTGKIGPHEAEMALAWSVDGTVAMNDRSSAPTIEVNRSTSIEQLLEDSRFDFLSCFESEKLSSADKVLAAWDRIKDSLDGTAASKDMDRVTFRGVCQVVNSCLRALEAAVFSDVDGIPERRASRHQTELHLLLVTINKVLSGIRGAVSFSPSHEYIMAPVVAAYIAALCGIQMYSKAQQVLKQHLGTSSDRTSYMTLSELLWSQQIQLQMTLPSLSAPDVVRRDLVFQLSTDVSEGNETIATILGSLGVYPHHVVLPGDWNLVRHNWSGQCFPEQRLKSFYRTCRDLVLSLYHPLSLSVSMANRPFCLRHFHPDVAGVASPLPCSLLVTGSCMVTLDLTSCGLRVLSPHFGHYFPSLEVTTCCVGIDILCCHFPFIHSVPFGFFSRS